MWTILAAFLLPTPWTIASWDSVRPIIFLGVPYLESILLASFIPTPGSDETR